MPERRRNGFKPPFPALQICTWIYLPILMLEFLFFVSPILPLAASIPCTLLFLLFCLASAYYTYMACITDPMDEHLAKHLVETTTTTDDELSMQPTCCYRPPNLGENERQETKDDDDDDLKYCWVCETSVSQHSMHCKFCNKCVSHFDHHCLWLNTCVGSANYAYFYRILWSTCLMLLVHIACMLGIIVDVFLGGTLRDRANNEWFGSDLWPVVAGVNIFFLLSNVAALSAVAQLLNFHVGLQRKNMTTYQFIITDNARRRQDFQKKEERRSDRLAAIVKAKREGQVILAIRLQMGQHCCPPCDPLPQDEEQAASIMLDATATANGRSGGGSAFSSTVVNNNNNNSHNETNASSGYAELSDDADDQVTSFAEEKASMSSSERDLARTVGASFGGSSSASQLESSSATATSITNKIVVQQPEDDDGATTNPVIDVVMEEKSKEMAGNGVDVVVDLEATTDTSSNVAMDSSNGTNRNGVQVEGKSEHVGPTGEKQGPGTDNI